MIRRSARRGFTLVELLVGIALATILVGVASGIFLQSRRIYDRSLGEIAMANEVRGATDALQRDLRDIQLPRKAGWDLSITHQNGAAGPNDILVYVTMEGEARRNPMRVELRLGPPDDEGRSQLLRKVIGRYDATADAIDPVDEPATALLGGAVSFEVQYAWAPPGTVQGQQFVRGPGGDPGQEELEGPEPNDGRFVLRSEGTVVDGKLTIAAGEETWHDTKLFPRSIGHTLHITAPDTAKGRGYPILEVLSPTELMLHGAADGTIEFYVPLLPPALQLTVALDTPNGPRSITQVVHLKP